MAFCASTPKVLICLQKYDLRIYVVSNPGGALAERFASWLGKLFGDQA